MQGFDLESYLQCEKDLDSDIASQVKPLTAVDMMVQTGIANSNMECLCQAYEFQHDDTAPVHISANVQQCNYM